MAGHGRSLIDPIFLARQRSQSYPLLVDQEQQKINQHEDAHVAKTSDQGLLQFLASSMVKAGHVEPEPHDDAAAIPSQFLQTPIFNQQQLPCRTVRIFISSTFKDFFNEREVLVKRVFPRLRDFCERRGLFLVECDLRWGVPKDATGEDAIVACMNEIERGVEETQGRNFFLGLLGERYGWCPKMEEISPHLLERYQWIENASVTLMEMVLGLLRTNTPNGLIMFRVPRSDFLDCLPDEEKIFFAEKDIQAKMRVKFMQSMLRKRFQQGSQFMEYSCHYEGLQVDPYSGKSLVKLSGFEEFEEKVYHFFTSAIEKTFNADTSHSTSPNTNSSQTPTWLHLEQEHLVTVSCLLRYASNSVTLLQELRKCLVVETTTEESDSQQLLCLQGSAGSGKSTMLAALLSHLWDSQPEAQYDGRIFFHFCGASVASKSSNNLMNRLKSQVQNMVPKESLETNAAAEEEVNPLWRCMTAFARHHWPRPCYIFLDALDEMTSMRDWKWLTKEALPSNLWLIISCLSDENGGPNWIRRQLNSAAVVDVWMPPMHLEQAAKFVTTYFREYGKTLTRTEMTSLLAHTSSCNPLWLSLACEEVRVHGDYFSLELVIAELPEGISALYQRILVHLKMDECDDFVSLFLRLLLISRCGLRESELARMLTFISGRQETLSALKVSDLLRNLKPFVHLVGVPVPVVRLRHRIARETLLEIMTNRQETKDQENWPWTSLHGRVADYFQQSLSTGCQEVQQSGNCHVGLRITEMLYHRFQAGQRASILEEITSWRGRIYFNAFQRSRLLNHLRCRLPVMNLPNSNSSLFSPIQRICQSCQIHRRMPPSMNSCFYCGLLVPSTGYPARVCQWHLQQNRSSTCSLCRRHFPPKLLTDLQLCRLCEPFVTECSILVTEKDVNFALTARPLPSQVGSSLFSHPCDDD